MALRSASRLLLALPFVLLLAVTATGAAQEARGPVLVLTIDGAIGPATAEYVENGLERASEEGAEAMVLRMDTPGGLDASMRDIIRGILASPVPVVAYVAPRGARAASAGTYIMYASHVAAMAPATNLGAATPVQIGGGSPLPGPEQPREPEPTGDGEEGEGADSEDGAPRDAMTAKAVNDAVAYIRGLAELRGRNADWAETAVREAASLSASRAVELNVADLMAADVDALLDSIDGREVEVAGVERTLRTAGAETVRVDPDWRIRLLSLLTNPNIALVLMTLGFYGIIFEIINPGSIFPGVLGVICLTLALYALNVLPVNWAGAALILLGVGFLIAEMFVSSFGVLGVGGIIAFGIGATILFDTGVPGFGISMATIITVSAALGAAMLVLMFMVVRAHRRPVFIGEGSVVGESGTVEEWSDGRGLVRIGGELWHGRGPALTPGQGVRVVGIKGLTLEVEPEGEQQARKGE